MQNGITEFLQHLFKLSQQNLNDEFIVQLLY